HSHSLCSGLDGACFFFSSRRRHTRSKRDWSSDVCSSDLVVFSFRYIDCPSVTAQASSFREVLFYKFFYCRNAFFPHFHQCHSRKIGRASCRERGGMSAVVGSIRGENSERDGGTRRTWRRP